MGQAIKIEVNSKVLEKNLKRFSRSVSARAIVGIIKLNAKPLVSAIKQGAPERPKEGKPNKRFGKVYYPGNLKRSVGTKSFTRGSDSMGDLSVYVGANKGTVADGWYAKFVELGTQGRAGRGRITPNPFIARAAQREVPNMKRDLEKDIATYTTKLAKRLGFK